MTAGHWLLMKKTTKFWTPQLSISITQLRQYRCTLSVILSLACRAEELEVLNDTCHTITNIVGLHATWLMWHQCFDAVVMVWLKRGRQVWPKPFNVQLGMNWVFSYSPKITLTNLRPFQLEYRPDSWADQSKIFYVNLFVKYIALQNLQTVPVLQWNG